MSKCFAITNKWAANVYTVKRCNMPVEFDELSYYFGTFNPQDTAVVVLLDDIIIGI